MAVVETIKIEGDASGLEDSIKKINDNAQKLKASIEGVGSGLKSSFTDAGKSIDEATGKINNAKKSFDDLSTATKKSPKVSISADTKDLSNGITELNKETKKLNETIESVGNTAKKAFDKTEKSVEGVQREVEKTNSSFKELANSAKSIALVSVALDTAKEAFTANQAVADLFNTALGAVQLTVSRIFDSFSKGTALNLGSVISDASEVVQLEKEATRSAAQRTAVQLEYQLLAEQARQVRDDEQKSIEDRIEANLLVSDILTEQLAKEKQLVQASVDAAAAQFAKLPSIENEVALIQARTELVDIEERVAGQRSEFLMNQMSLNREQQTYNELLLKNGEIIEGEQSVIIQINENRRKALDDEYNAQVKILDIEIEIARTRLKSAAEGTVAQQEAYEAYLQITRDKGILDAEYARSSKELDREVSDARYQMYKDGLSAISQLSAAFAGEDEESKKRQFEFQKKLSLASAVVSGIEAVQNAYKTAQASPYTIAFPGYPIVQAGLAAAFSVAQIASISRTQFESPDAGGVDSGSGYASPSAPTIPQFNVVGRGGINQLADSVNAINNRPVRAYVVAGEVTSQQNLNRRRARTATFG
jgi:hypothetical protein